MPWFMVTAEKFDWMPSPRRMVTYLPGEKPHFGSSRMIESGLEQKVIVVIPPPKDWVVNKDGKVVRK